MNVNMQYLLCDNKCVCVCLFICLSVCACVYTSPILLIQALLHSAVLATSLARMLRPWVTAVAYAAYATFVSPLSAAASIVGKLETSEALL